MSTYSVILSDVAELELQDNLTYLTEKEDGLSDKFLKELKFYATLLSENPYLFRKVIHNFRKMYMKKFKYTVVYEVYDDHKEVVIWSIIHQSRDPRRWMDRIKKPKIS